MTDFDSIVIGSGAGGLTAATALARAGQRVLVLEQHYLPGGWCHSFPLGGYQFSPGVHYIGALEPGGMMREIYEGLDVAGDMKFLELNPDGYDHIRVGHTTFDIPRGFDAYAERISAQFPHQAAEGRRYLEIMQKMGRELMVAGRAQGPGELARVAVKVPTLLRFGLRSVRHVLDHCGVTDPVLRTILTVQSGDHGMGPSKAPAGLHAAVVSHYFNGAYYPKGGGRALPKAFIKELKRQGGQIKVRAQVSRILLETSGRRPRAVGVELADGTRFTARHIVSNADPHITYSKLIGDEHLPWRLRRRLARTKYSLSCLSLFMASDMDLEGRGLDSGNYWYSATADSDEAYRYAADRHPLTRGPVPSVFLTATTLKDRTKRRDGVHTLEAFTFVSHKAFERWKGTQHGERPPEYGAFKQELADRVLHRLDELVPGLRDSLVFCDVGTPLTNRFYCEATQGNLYGIEKSRWQVGPLAFPVTTPFAGLRMCGASTLSHGVAGATMSGLVAAQTVLRCSRSELLTGTSEVTILPADRPDLWPAAEGKRAVA